MALVKVNYPPEKDIYSVKLVGCSEVHEVTYEKTDFELIGCEREKTLRSFVKKPPIWELEKLPNRLEYIDDHAPCR